MQGDCDIIPNIKHMSNQLLSIHVVSIRSVDQLITVGRIKSNAHNLETGKVETCQTVMKRL